MNTNELPPFDSLASSLIFGVTMKKNRSPQGLSILSQVGYGVAAVVALVETAVAVVFTGLGFALTPWDRTPFNNSVIWLKSSSFSIAWASVNFILNLFTWRLIADERSAREVANSLDWLNLPHRAIL